MRSAFAALVFAMFDPTSAGAQAVPIIVRLGERVAITLDGRPTVVGRGRADATPADLAAAALIGAVPTPSKPVPSAGALPFAAPPLPVVPDQVTVRVIDTGARETVMVLENGYDRAVTYHAVISTRDGERPTDVCLLVPGKTTYEHWPYRSDQLALSDFTFAAWDGTAVPCA